MKTKRSFFSMLCVALLLSCNTTKQAVNDGKTVDDGKISFTFLQVNDVYEIAPLAGGKEGGLARVATLKKDLLKENPNTFTFMAGDFLSPSLLGTIKYKGKRIRGQQMIETMNAVGFDLAVFGNHEFDLSKDELQQRLNESEFAWTSANVRQKFCGDTFLLFRFSKKEME